MIDVTYDVIVVGGGLCGLTLARRLVQAGRTVALLEARDRLGGRILTVQDALGLGTFDLGPAWFWSEHQHVQALLRELTIPAFVQYDKGDALFDPGIGKPSQRFHPDWEMPIAYRFVGGVARLIQGLAAQLPSGTVHLNTQVRSIRQNSDHLHLEATQAGVSVSLRAKQVVVTLPPRLTAQSLLFEPTLPEELIAVMLVTQTWMAQAMKVVLVYPSPFWRRQGLSGLAISHIGPVQQFHDHTPLDQRCGALFGWIGNGSPARLLPAQTRQQQITEQAIRIFGDEARQPIHYAEMNWAQQPYTRTPEGLVDEQEHPHYGHPLLQVPQMDGRLYWAGSEVSTRHGGYLDGAIFVGEQIAKRLAPGSG